jgi:NAD-dependent deacetylase
MKNPELKRLKDLLNASSRTIIFTGAGISTDSGIPDFRSAGGIWSKFWPIDFSASEEMRRRSWSRNFATDSELKAEQPKRGHRAIAKLIESGKAACVITQNIDGLHQASGVPDKKIVELHGNTTYATCLDCGTRYELVPIKERFLRNKTIPTCGGCGGCIKAVTISFGRPMPEAPMQAAKAETELADLFIAIGSSLVVFLTASFPLLAAGNGAKLVIINREPTGIDTHANLVLNREIEPTLGEVVGVN